MAKNLDKGLIRTDGAGQTAGSGLAVTPMSDCEACPRFPWPHFSGSRSQHARSSLPKWQRRGRGWPALTFRSPDLRMCRRNAKGMHGRVEYGLLPK